MKRGILTWAGILLAAIAGGAGLKAQDTALVIIDIQEFYFPGGDMVLQNPEEAAMNAALLEEHFRKKGLPVIYIRHDHEPGGDIHPFVAPLPGEKVITKKHINAFLDTPLDSLLHSMGVTTLVMCGMQTQMCVEAAVRAGADLGYHIILVEDACATRPLSYGTHIIQAEDVHYATLATLEYYGKVTNVQEFLREEKDVQ